MRKDRGFTLIELLIVVAIIGIIAAIAIPNLLNAINRGRQKRTMSDMRTIATGIEQYEVDNNFYPKVANGISNVATYLEPTYVKRIPRTDGWNEAFAFLGDATNGLDYTIISYGKNHQQDGTYTPGTRTTTFNADIVYSDGQFIQWPEGMQVD
jgi:general secretion pathway protein G